MIRMDGESQGNPCCHRHLIIFRLKKISDESYLLYHNDIQKSN